MYVGKEERCLSCCSAYRARSSPGKVLPAASCQNGLQVLFSAQNNALAKSASSELCLSGFVVNCSELKQSLKVGITFLFSFPKQLNDTRREAGGSRGSCHHSHDSRWVSLTSHHGTERCQTALATIPLNHRSPPFLLGTDQIWFVSKSGL